MSVAFRDQLDREIAMKVGARHFLAMIASAVLTVLTGCNGASANSEDPSRLPFDRSPSTVQSAMSSIDYGEVIGSLKFLTPFDEGSGFAFAAPHQLLTKELTTAEARLVGVIVIDEKRQSTLFDTVMRVTTYYGKNGEMPLNGVELFLGSSVDNTEANHFAHLEPLVQYRQACSAINPVTGRFFESFSNERWSPGGLFMELETDPEYLSNHWTGYVDANGGAPQIWRVVVYGETEGRVLVDKHVAVNAQPKSISTPRMSDSETEPAKR